MKAYELGKYFTLYIDNKYWALPFCIQWEWGTVQFFSFSFACFDLHYHPSED